MKELDFRELWLRGEAAQSDSINVQRIYIDINDGNLVDGLMFSQIMYWHGYDKKGRCRLRVYKDGVGWVAKRYEDWHEECRVNQHTARKSIDRMVESGLLVKALYKFDGSPRVHVRVNWPEFERRIKSNWYERSNGSDTRGQMEVIQEDESLTETTTEIITESSELTLAAHQNGESKDSIKEATQPKVSDSTSDVSEPHAERGESVLAQAFPESQKFYEQRLANPQKGDKPQGWMQGLPAGIRRIREADWQIRRPEVEQLLGEFVEVTGLFPQSESARKQWVAAGNKQLKDYGMQTLVTDGLYRQAWAAIEADRKETGKKLSITSPYSIGFKIEELLQERAKAGDEDLTKAEMERLSEVFQRMKAKNLIVQAGMVWVVRADDTKLRSRQDFLTYADRLGW